MALEGNYTQALKTIESSCSGGCNNPIAWRVLGIMTYLYGSNSRKENSLLAVAYLQMAIDKSGDIDFDSMLLRGQLLMELGKAKGTTILSTLLLPLSLLLLLPTNPIQTHNRG